MKTRRWSRRMARALGSVVLALGLAAGTAASSGAAFAAGPADPTVLADPTAAPNPTPVQVVGLSRGELAPEPGSAAGLEGVYCTSAASCWAVGYFERNGAWLNEALRWNGHRWSRVAAPNPGGTASGDTSELFGIRCTAAVNCWAVGFYERHGVQLDEAIHWNGKKWSMVGTPTPAGTLSGDFNELIDVACTSPDSCWAAGEYGTDNVNGEEIENQALHWNGKKWSLAAVPDNVQSASGAFNVLQGLACTSAANCWAAGSDGYDNSSTVTLNQVLHWNGHKWSSVPVPEPDGVDAFTSNVLVGVSCSSAGNCWAVGYVGNLDLVAPVLNEALHWNGSHWSAASVPAPGGHADDDHSFLYGIRCTARTNCWAAGQAQPSGKVDRNALLHWNGTRWSAA